MLEMGGSLRAPSRFVFNPFRHITYVVLNRIVEKENI